jgi:membrane-bound metal-dependent hydrolase YbcI (DUF457 family)
MRYFYILKHACLLKKKEFNVISIPFTPYHLGPSTFFGLLILKWVDFPTLLIASVIIDIEPIIVIVFNLSYPLHGMLHSFLGAFLAALLLIFVMKFLRKYFTPVMTFFKLKQEVTLRSISIGAFLGTFSHVLLDVPLYWEMNPFFPLRGNPFFIKSSFGSSCIYLFCAYCFLGALLTYFIKLMMQISKDKKRNLKL